LVTLTNRQARQFLLLKQGLLGGYRYIGKEGVLAFVRDVGCVQFDPVDVCGRNADIALNSRVRGYRKEMLDGLLYKDRLLVDFFDKNLSIFPIEDLPAFIDSRHSGGYAEAYDRRGGDAVREIEPLVRRLIKERGHISASEVGIDETLEWHWGVMTSLPRAALESMYYRGELIIHHKTGTHKSYALMEDCVPAQILGAMLPYGSEDGCLAWHVKRRIGAVGMLWNKPSDAWLGLRLKSAERARAFSLLLDCGAIIQVAVEGIEEPLYIREDDGMYLEMVLSGAGPGGASEAGLKPRTEFVAPLDSLMWDRKLIKALFGFEYKWEIYTPADKRRYGAYVLPVLHGESFIGRIEAACDRKAKTLCVRNIWYEGGVRRTKKLQKSLDAALSRFAKFNECDIVQWKESGL
jgi:uncharacterized protein YcaQ